jgi:hypothetical protein
MPTRIAVLDDYLNLAGASADRRRGGPPGQEPAGTGNSQLA